ncbi:hypothetical protein JAAARDRAFT_141386 [Jaapia argillacea MUCL 33604]|uniref:NADP-dependent oxidoreductase domain-containing protein n=1 Tax=Jaapia argillacea MUCL 33604 TaxID=933084 RepID=A0A067P7N4_9AGAM|nr:hypothetical protein JAAARDRAFT_141386 [Jaapia argillacea MUCL 33604]
MTSATRKIGNTEVSAIGYGAMAYATTAEEDWFKIFDALLEKGCTFWDTANVYGQSEEMIGKWFKKTGNRSKIFLATKFGFTMSDAGQRFINGDPSQVRPRLEESLAKLRTDYVDLYYLHRADPLVPIEKTVAAMAELVKEGKVHHLGLSEISSQTLRRAHAVHPISAIQVEYSPFTLDIEDPKIGLLKTARELGVTVVAYSPLGRGLITGQYKGPEDFPAEDFRRHIDRYSTENFPNILKLASGLAEIGKRHDATAGQVALAWLLAQGDDVIPIPGTRQIKYLEENLAAIKVKLTSRDIEEVREIAAKADAAHGDRYPAFIMQYMFVDTPEL